MEAPETKETVESSLVPVVSEASAVSSKGNGGYINTDSPGKNITIEWNSVAGRTFRTVFGTEILIKRVLYDNRIKGGEPIAFTCDVIAGNGVYTTLIKRQDIVFGDGKEDKIDYKAVFSRKSANNETKEQGENMSIIDQPPTNMAYPNTEKVIPGVSDAPSVGKSAVVATAVATSEEKSIISENSPIMAEVPTKRGRGRPKGSKNKVVVEGETSIPPSEPKKRGRPKGSKNKPKV